ncbi:MAG TPA: hypothetical protein VH092_26830 [Urbifossiella sp.]|jgi:hypothetical protein|nr:hypothetical protein [Urbifossiella sp.]
MPLLRLLAAAGWVAAFLPLAAARPPADDAARVLARWERLRQEAPAVRYTLRSEWFPANLKSDAPKPGEGGAYTGTGVVLFDPANGRLRVDTDERHHFQNRRERLSRVRTTIRYDGREQSAGMVIDVDAATAPADPVFRNISVGPWGLSMGWPDQFDPLLWGHGRAWTPRDTGARTFPLGWRVGPAQFQPVGREGVDGRVCVVLRDTAAGHDRTERLWVDDERGGIVRWRTEWPSGRSVETAVAYQETPRGWFPWSWEETSTPPGQPPALRRRVRVEAVEFDPPVAADDFRLQLRPGMRVHTEKGETETGADGSLEPIHPADGKESRPKSAAVRLFGAALGLGWPVVAGLGAAVVLGGVLVRLRWRRGHVGG